ncbi:Phage integrase, N-terminal SAM-like domain [Cyclonatronum proteinivorum]|uniref:Phage integrase, N-terminal SAM-like domain n=1 Tax=Cyclonatronum proteinivorum TaxID=1457365 RepID=A0A345UI42_9BACT|nr:site-specific integrase [Cyclonatronum proteinivorum]AXJ00144.1 Phage integrase, N-terminal SAM-like domain [Cyclonatronum proteinivorum]
MKLLTHLRLLMESEHYSERTIRQYKGWISDLIHFHYKRHPLSLSDAEIRLYLHALRHYHGLKRYKLNQCESAILYLYRNVLGKTDFVITDEQHPIHSPHPVMLETETPSRQKARPQKSKQRARAGLSV